MDFNELEPTKPKSKPKPKPKSNPDEIISVTNISKVNVFTVCGRVLPNQTVNLERSIAVLYEGLVEG